MIKIVRAHWLGVLLAVIIGSLMSDAIGSFMLGLYDRLNPVATTTAVRADRPGLAFHFRGVKYRDCVLEGVWAYDVTPPPLNTKNRLIATREDSVFSAVHQLGPFASSVAWIITPEPKAKLELWQQHNCDGRSVVSQIQIEGMK